ncbi:MAG: sugar ABC transporter permease [Deltaproteobacteria bacterium]|nr:sugar ABC transporter permease [Deltaproteobacteria bacterium]MBW2153738.1 sugar ABC transporter permease [Deltaproteobacteria bacterium]
MKETGNYQLKEKLSIWFDTYCHWILILPCVIVIAAVIIYPVIYTLNMSFHSWFISATTKPKFIALANYFKMFTGDERFVNAFKVTVYFTGVSVFIELVLGVGLAQFFNREFFGKSFARSLMILPVASTPVAISLVWRNMYDPTRGIVNYFLSLFNISELQWLKDPITVIPSLIIIDVWQWTPLVMLIALAGMTALPLEPYEAAIIDGASPWQIFRHITLPLIRPSIVVAAIFRFIDSVKTFDMIFVTSEGGPGVASQILNLYIFDQGFRYFHMGYASSLLVVLFFGILAISFVLIQVRRFGL